MASMPTTDVPHSAFGQNVKIIELLEMLQLIPSRGEGRRLIAQGGIKINDEKITDHEHIITEADFKDGYILVQKGKKIYHRGRLV